MKFFSLILSAGVLSLFLTACGKPLGVTGKKQSEPPVLPYHDAKVTYKIHYGENLSQSHEVTQNYSIREGETKKIVPPYPWRVFSRQTDIRSQVGNRYRSQYAHLLRAIETNDRIAFVSAMDVFFEYRIAGDPTKVDQLAQAYLGGRMLRWKKWYELHGKPLLVSLTDTEQIVAESEKRLSGNPEEVTASDLLIGESLFQMGELPEWEKIVARQTRQMRASQKEHFPHHSTEREIPVFYAPIAALRTELEMAFLAKQSFELNKTEKYFATIDPIYENTAKLRYDALLSTEIAVLLQMNSSRVRFDIEATDLHQTQSFAKATYGYNTKDLLEKKTELNIGKLRVESSGITLEER